MPRRPALTRALASLAVGLLAALPLTATALPNRSVGVVSAMTVRPSMGLTDVPIARIAGKEFVFLEKPACDQGIGYPAFRLASAADEPLGATTDPLANVPKYEDFVGKVIRAEAVEAVTCPRSEYTVTFTVPETGARLVAHTFTQAIADVAPVDDLTAARQRWLGRIIYPRQRTLQTYDAANGQYGELEVRLTEPLKVVDILWGLSASKPLWVVVQRDTGERAFIATAFSWTNAYVDRWSVRRPWDDKLAESNIKYELRQNVVPGSSPREIALADPKPFRFF